MRSASTAAGSPPARAAAARPRPATSPARPTRRPASRRRPSCQCSVEPTHLRSLLPTPAAGHREAALFLGRGRRELAGDAALVDDEDAVGERQDLLELERDKEDGAACVPLLEQAAVDALDCADAEAARASRPSDRLRVAVDLAGEHALLLVPAGKRGRGRRRRAA